MLQLLQVLVHLHLTHLHEVELALFLGDAFLIADAQLQRSLNGTEKSLVGGLDLASQELQIGRGDELLSAHGSRVRHVNVLDRAEKELDVSVDVGSDLLKSVLRRLRRLHQLIWGACLLLLTLGSHCRLRLPQGLHSSGLLLAHHGV